MLTTPSNLPKVPTEISFQSLTCASRPLCLHATACLVDKVKPTPCPLLSSAAFNIGPPSATNIEHPEACMEIQRVEHIGMLVPLRLRQGLAEDTVMHGAGEVAGFAEA